MDGLEKIKAEVKCCITGKPLNTCKHINMVQVMKKAKWKYPVWGNFVTGHRDMAVAYVHDDCIGEDGRIIGDVKFAIELKGDEWVYHPVETLETA